MAFSPKPSPKREPDPNLESGARPVIESGLRPARMAAADHGLPRMWDDDDQTDITNTTALFAAARQNARHPRLTVITGIHAGQIIALEGKDEFFLGRSRSADVSLHDQGISRVHCRIARRDDGFLVEDLGSTNGTLLNGTLIGSASLKEGDRVQLGPNAVVQLGFLDPAEDHLARQLFDASTRDPLTRAYNRRYFCQRLDEEISYAHRHRSGLAIMLLDLDFFKSINDSSGHAAGDAILRGVVNEISQCVRTEDLLTRYGGEEFALLVRVGSLDEARRFADRIRSRIESLRITFEAATLKVTVSIGVAELSECSPRATSEEILGLADRRLYRAKLLGRNRVCSG